MEPAANHSPTKRALLALKQLQTRLDQLEADRQEPIAIVGMGCRWPGAENPQDLWQLLQQQRDVITEVPPDRWHWQKLGQEAPELEAAYRYGGFLPHLLDFDASFFRIAPREAASLDPQQRLLLEVSWEALEQGGLAADRLVGSNTGVFVGVCSIDYWQRLLARQNSEIDAYLTTGNTHSLAAGRISYVLGFTGPSLAIDTACSSSLVALHSACQSLRQRDCDLALAGGVNRILEPATSINFAKARMLSSSGRCRSFDAAADGFVRSEGCGVVVLKRWRDAVAAGDAIQAVILGSAVNHDGRSSGLTVPNGVAQQQLIRQALKQSRIEPDQVGYIETHGTGTALGDPIEVNALAAVFGDRAAAQPLILGAVKTNIGHTEAAAGMAGLIKAVLALQHAEIPANLHFHTPNPQINWAELPLQVPTRSHSWKSDARIAGISAFGFNGTNAHVIIADRPPGTSAVALRSEQKVQPSQLLTLSAKTEAALQQLVERYREYLKLHPETDLADLCYTANSGRSQFNYRLAILTDSRTDLQAKLTQATSGQFTDHVLYGRSNPADSVLAASLDLPTLAKQYIAGASIDWSPEIGLEPGLEPGSVTATNAMPRRILDLPTYPFQRQHYGVERT